VSSARVQLCGPFAVELSGRQVNQALPGRQARLLFAYLTLFRLQPVPRDTLVEALWGDAPPPEAGAALSALISKVRVAGLAAGLVVFVDRAIRGAAKVPARGRDAVGRVMAPSACRSARARPGVLRRGMPRAWWG
jgi:hypothetical protein